MKPSALISSESSENHSFRMTISDFLDLIKARLTTFVLLTTIAGFYLGWRGPISFVSLFHAAFGVWLIAAGTAALNQLIERDPDALMHRTCDRPLPSGRFSPDLVLIIGFCLVGGGLIYVSTFVNLLTALLGAFTTGIYLFVYTPLKRITTLNTLIGAIPGAIPPVMGWTAATGSLEGRAWILGAILFFWQMPHFFAIAWLHREDYARGGFVMVPLIDEQGKFTGRLCINYSLALLLVSLIPSLCGITTASYFFGAFILSLGMVWFSIVFQKNPSNRKARSLFFTSIIYLPLLLVWLVICKNS